MSTSDVLSVINGAQLLARLKLELGVKKVQMSYWAAEKGPIRIWFRLQNKFQDIMIGKLLFYSLGPASVPDKSVVFSLYELGNWTRIQVRGIGDVCPKSSGRGEKLPLE